MLPDDLYHAHVLVARDGGVFRHPAGRFMIKDGNLHHLEDYHGLLGSTIPEGVVDDLTVHKINNCGPHLSIASHHDLVAGHRLDFIPEHPLPQMLPDPKVQASQPAVMPPPMPKFAPVFHYHRAGHDKPHVVEAKGGKYLLDGNPLEHDEVQAILDNVRTGAAKLRYAQTGALAKAEASESHLDRLGVTEDPMMPGVGNKYAYQEFRKKNEPGVWASIDLNDVKHLNSVHGHDSGDALVRAFGAAARAGAEGKVKLFRSGGDEFVMHAPDATTAYNTMRAIRHHVDQIPHVHGVYRPSFSVGFGNSSEDAGKALQHAKARKVAGAFAAGTAPHLAHSLVPGSEGEIPLDESQLGLTPPTA